MVSQLFLAGNLKQVITSAVKHKEIPLYKLNIYVLGPTARESLAQSQYVLLVRRRNWHSFQVC